MMPVLINQAPVECINTASSYFHIPAVLILAVIKKESGRNGDAIKNKNGTYDYGIMQINGVWLPKILAYGYTKEDLQYNACKNIFVGTWILSQGIAEGQNIWQGVGNYHSHTPGHNLSYSKDIFKYYEKISYAIYHSTIT